MAKTNKNEEQQAQTINEESDIDKLLEEFTQKGIPEQTKQQDDGEKSSRKPVRAVKTINADGRLLAAYEALKKEGYKKSFDDFLVDASMFFAKGKYGLDFIIEKSLTPDNDNTFFKVRKKDSDEEDDDNDGKRSDPLDLAIKLLMGGGNSGIGEDPRLQVLTTLLEQRRLELEEKRTRIEREKLENEKIKAEIENMKKAKSEEQTQKNTNSDVMDVIKFIVDQNQKFYESMADIYKATATNKGSNNNETLELYKMLSQQQQQYYQTMTNFLTNTQMEKIRELESYVSSMNPGVWLTQKAEEFKALRDIFGGGSGKSPEEIEREYQLRLEELKLKHEEQKEARETQRAIELTNSIKEGLSTFTEQIGKPLGEAIASQIRNMSNKAPVPANTPSPPVQATAVSPKKYSIELKEENKQSQEPKEIKVEEPVSGQSVPLHIYSAPAEQQPVEEQQASNDYEEQS